VQKSTGIGSGRKKRERSESKREKSKESALQYNPFFFVKWLVPKNVEDPPTKKGGKDEGNGRDNLSDPLDPLRRGDRKGNVKNLKKRGKKLRLAKGGNQKTDSEEASQKEGRPLSTKKGEQEGQVRSSHEGRKRKAAGRN